MKIAILERKRNPNLNIPANFVVDLPEDTIARIRQFCSERKERVAEIKEAIANNEGNYGLFTPLLGEAFPDGNTDWLYLPEWKATEPDRAYGAIAFLSFCLENADILF